MKKISSPLEVVLGCALGAALQPVSLWVVMNYFSWRPPIKDWGLAIYPFAGMYASIIPIQRGVLQIPSFGVAQAFTIVPAAFLMCVAGTNGIARGLLLLGTALALANVGVILYVYTRYYSTIS